MTTKPTPSTIIADLIAREGGYTNHPADRGGPTCWGITEHTARAYGYMGDMRDLPKDAAFAIYRSRYWELPGYRAISDLGLRLLAVELLDTGVNMGTSTASKMLQRVLNALNNRQTLWADLTVDGNIGPLTIQALRRIQQVRGDQAEAVLLTGVNCLQGARYIELAESDPSQEAFCFGWLTNRVGATL